MKHILLTSAAYLNGGAYVDAGTTVPIGDEKHAITDERAADIVKGKRAEEVDLPDVDADGDSDSTQTGAATGQSRRGSRAR